MNVIQSYYQKIRSQILNYMRKILHQNHPTQTDYQTISNPNITYTYHINNASHIYYKLCDLDPNIIYSKLHITADGYWYDLFTKSGPNGYNKYFYQSESYLRCPQYRYYQLMFVIAPSDLNQKEYNDYVDKYAFGLDMYQNKHQITHQITINLADKINEFKLGNKSKSDTNAYSLYAFANDVKYFYWNNNLFSSNMKVDISLS